MALSPQDKLFYQEKLGWKSFLMVWGGTVGVSAILWPVMLFLMDWSAGATSKWNMQVATNVALCGFLLGTVVSVVMYLGFRFFLEMGWLPARH